MYAGTDKTIGLSVTEGGEAKDLTDAELIFVMWNNDTRIVKALETGLAVVDGKVVVTLSRADTAAGPFGIWFYQLGIVDQNDIKDIIPKGTIEVVNSDLAKWPEAEGT
jgi:hypothetical protein